MSGESTECMISQASYIEHSEADLIIFIFRWALYLRSTKDAFMTATNKTYVTNVRSFTFSADNDGAVSVAFVCYIFILKHFSLPCDKVEKQKISHCLFDNFSTVSLT